MSFAGPFLVATAAAWGRLGWSVRAPLIAGTALSTTSLAVVYALLVETGLASTRVGKLIMSACFVTPNAWFPLFLAGSVALIVALPRVARWFFRRHGNRVIEPEIKLVFVFLFVLMVLANAANGHAVSTGLTFGAISSLYGWFSPDVDVEGAAASATSAA